MLLKKLTRFANIKNLWDILGDVWKKAKYNKGSEIEGFWALNEILAQGRVNSINYLYERLMQFRTFSYLDIFILETEKIIKRKKINGFDNEFKIFNNDIESHRGQKITHVFPPTFFTNTLLPFEYCESIHNNNITHINSRDKSILVENKLPTNNIKNYVFSDINDNYFFIKDVNQNLIEYLPVVSGTNPAPGQLSILNKYELNRGIDFDVEERRDSLVIFFKDFFDFIDENIFTKREKLFTVDLPYCDNFLEENFAKPIGFPVDAIKEIIDTKVVDQKIIQFWKLNQLPYNFKQIYRIANMLLGYTHCLSINDTEVIYDISIDKKIVKTGRLRTRFFGNPTNYTALPDTLKTNITKPTNVFDSNIIEIDGNIDLLNIQKGSIIIINKDVYKVTDIYNSKFLKLNKNISVENSFTECKLLSNEGLRNYIIDDYGLDVPNIDNLKVYTAKWGVKQWGTFKFGDIYMQPINTKSNFIGLEIGQEYTYGDPFKKIIHIDFSELFKDVIFIQKFLAKKNLEINEKNLKQYFNKPVLLLTPFLNYSKQFDFLQNNLLSWTEYLGSGSITKSIQTKTSFYLENTKLTFSASPCNISYPVNLADSNKYGTSLLRAFIKVNNGAVRFGICDQDSFLIDGAAKKQFQDIKNDEGWVFVNLFIKKDNIKQDSNFIRLEAIEENTEVEIFGVEFWNGVPEFTEKMHKLNNVLEEIINTNDYKIINLL